MKYSLFIDDERNLSDVTWMNLSEMRKHPVKIARSMKEATTIIRNEGFPSFVSFDHDLGKDEPTGKDIANWLIDCDLEGGGMPGDFGYCVHSQNPVGKENIQGLMNSYLRFKSLKKLATQGIYAMHVYVLKWKYRGKITIYNTSYIAADLLTAILQLNRDFAVIGQKVELISFDLQDF